MPLSRGLISYLSKGNLPLLNSSGLVLWRELVTELKRDCAGTIDEIKHAMTGGKFRTFGARFSTSVWIGDDEYEILSSSELAVLGALNARLCEDFGVLSQSRVIQGLVVDLRELMDLEGVPDSQIQLSLHPDHGMANGMLAPTLTCLPGAGFPTFGTQPDQVIIGGAAPMWNTLKRRRYENRGTTKYGSKPHYVLAHLLNHNLNGPGNDARNVVPFWATANTEMAREAEKQVKELVLMGATVEYNIDLGPDVGMTQGRQQALAACQTQDEADIVDCEQYLPSHLRITCDVLLVSGQWQKVLDLTVNNFVPETVPAIL
ncbi:MAG: hypothetical protein KDE55_01735 [Novosphingobium sp.]|nr:hypothetical protein [Novosphingobium sp.]